MPQAAKPAEGRQPRQRRVNFRRCVAATPPATGQTGRGRTPLSPADVLKTARDLWDVGALLTFENELGIGNPCPAKLA